MRRRWREIGLIGAIALVLLTAVGCGSGSSSTSDGGTTEQAASSSAGKPPLGAKGRKAAAKYGRASSAAELAEVSNIVEASLRARGERDWAGQCATLSKRVKVTIAAAPEAKKLKGCPAQLGAQGKNAPDSLLRDDMAGGVAEFRVKGGKEGYAYYHGTDGKDRWLPMLKEGGEWKVAALIGNEVEG